LKVRKKIKDFIGVVDTYTNIGIVYDQKAQYPDALDNYFKALSFYDKQSAPEKQAMTCKNIGIVYKTQKEFVKALQYYSKAYETYNKTSDEFGKTVSAGNLGSMLILFGKYAESIRYS
jgi:tetratricopeptide (TPR) repeat protein